MADTFLVWNDAGLKALFESPSGPVAQELYRRGLQVQNAARTLAPVDTGRLRSSINLQIGRDGEGLYALVGTDVEYGIYQEFGTVHMPAQPFLIPALQSVAGQA